MASRTPATTTPPHPRGPLARLVHQHEQLEELIAARRSHGLSTKEPWLAMVRLEDKLADEHPSAFAHWIAIWAQRRSPVAHPRGQRCASCPLCQQTGGTPTQPFWKTGQVPGTITSHDHGIGAALRR